MNRALNILKRLFTIKVDNWRVLVLCLVGAGTFWVFKALNKNYTTTIQYPVYFSFDNEQYIVVNELPTDISINVTGMGWDIFRKSAILQSKPIQFLLEKPSEYRKVAGSFFLPKVVDHFNDIEVNFIATDSLSLDIQPRITRSFVLALDQKTLVFADKTLMVGAPELNVDTVQLTGPEQLINNQSDTIFLDMSGYIIEEPFERNVDIVGTGSGLVHRDPVQVQVKINVVPLVEKSIQVKAHWTGSPEDTTQIANLPLYQLNYLVTAAYQNTEDSVRLEVPYAEWIKNDTSTVVPYVAYMPDYLHQLEVTLIRE